jgi:Na+-translocating ferredoxin:NAD+ oxidoreductase RNF subunit RnfB
MPSNLLPYREEGKLAPALRRWEVRPMTLCPVALAVGCEKCPIFQACPLKTVIGDQKKLKVVEKKDPPKPVEK